VPSPSANVTLYFTRSAIADVDAITIFDGPSSSSQILNSWGYGRQTSPVNLLFVYFLTNCVFISFSSAARILGQQ
jgi:hypothetical protein